MLSLIHICLDIPEITLVAILDADKEGFRRSETSLIQTIGRAARNSEGHVIMYADVMTDSMPVSYTHLDVYKRQDGECLHLICHLRRIPIIIIGTVFRNILFPELAV